MIWLKFVLGVLLWFGPTIICGLLGIDTSKGVRLVFNIMAFVGGFLTVDGIMYLYDRCRVKWFNH